MFVLTGILIFIIGGLVGRIRGQAEPWSHTVSRYGVWGVPVGELVLAATHDPLFALCSVVSAGIGATFGYWGQFDFTAPGNWNIKNYAALTLTGMLRFFPLFAFACLLSRGWHIFPAVIAGVLFVPIYMVLSRLSNRLPNLGTLFNGWTCYAEFLFWGILYSALAAGLYA